jgi:hypothetical protein
VVPYMDETIKLTSFPKYLLKKEVLPGVLECPNPLKTDKVSPCLFTNLQKTTSYLCQNDAKQLLEGACKKRLELNKKSIKFLSKIFTKLTK